MREIEILESAAGDGVVIAINGSVDHTNAEAFRASLAAPLGAALRAGKVVVLDLGGLEYINSAGLRILMMMANEAKESAGRILLANRSDTVKEIFEISRLHHLIECFDTVDAALANLANT